LNHNTKAVFHVFILYIQEHSGEKHKKLLPFLGATLYQEKIFIGQEDNYKQKHPLNHAQGGVFRPIIYFYFLRYFSPGAGPYGTLHGNRTAPVQSTILR